VAKSKKKSHQVNKQYYDRKAKQRYFEVNGLAYMYNPAKKAGLTRKFYKPWHGPYLVTKKLSDLSYEIADQNGKTQVVHVNRLKRAYNSESWAPGRNDNQREDRLGNTQHREMRATKIIFHLDISHW
jgi:hypothetical protein